MRLFERAIGALTLVAGAVWSIYVLLLGSNAGLPFPVVLVLIWGIAALVVLWMLRVALHLLVTRRAPETRKVRKLLIGPVAWVFCFLLVWTEAAFWLRFQLSKPALDHYAERASPTIASGSFTPGTHVGLFWLREAEVLPGGVVRLITTECMLDDCGLAYSPGGSPPVVGEDRYHPVGGRWYQWWRSW